MKKRRTSDHEYYYAPGEVTLQKAREEPGRKLATVDCSADNDSDACKSKTNGEAVCIQAGRIFRCEYPRESESQTDTCSPGIWI